MTCKTSIRRVLQLVFVLALLPHPLFAAEKSLGEYKDWNAYSFTESGKTVCVIWGAPAKSEGDYTRRGAVRVFIAHRRWTQPKRINEVSFEIGYTFQEDSEVKVSVDAEAFDLFTDGDTAWNRTATDDARMVQAMRIGKTLTVEGVSSRGTKTTDTYSLFGFTAAHNAINEACGVQ